MNHPKPPNKDHGRSLGRPPVLDPEKRRLIVALLRVGCSRRVAARHAGCSASTITRTAARDPAFSDQIARAETYLEIELLGAIRHAAKTDRYWRAAAWLLEKRSPQDYSRRSRAGCSAGQAMQLFRVALDSLRQELAAPEREEAMEKLGGLLLEYDPDVSDEQ